MSVVNNYDNTNYNLQVELNATSLKVKTKF